HPAGAPGAGHRGADPARPARPRPASAAAHPARVSCGGAAASGSRYPLRTSDHRRLGAAGAAGNWSVSRMAEASAEKAVVVEATPDALADSVADRFLIRRRARTKNGRLAHLALTGGSMGGTVLQAVAEHPKVDRIDWSLVHFWWGDERFVPRDDADRNAVQSRHALLDRIAVPPENVHEIAASDDDLTLDE